MHFQKSFLLTKHPNNWHIIKLAINNLGFALRWEGVKLPACLKPVRTTPETLNLVRKYKHIYSLRKHTLSTKTPLILLMSSFFPKNQRFFSKISTFIQSSSMRTLLDIF